MRITTRCKNLSTTEKSLFNEYLEEKIERLKPLMKSHYPDKDTVLTNCRIERHERHNAYEITFDIKAPHGGTFETKVVKHDIKEAMDLSTDKLEQQVIKHFKKLTGK